MCVGASGRFGSRRETKPRPPPPPFTTTPPPRTSRCFMHTRSVAWDEQACQTYRREALRALCVTWNVGESKPEAGSAFFRWVHEQAFNTQLAVMGLQEIEMGSSSGGCGAGWPPRRRQQFLVPALSGARLPVAPTCACLVRQEPTCLS